MLALIIVGPFVLYPVFLMRVAVRGLCSPARSIS